MKEYNIFKITEITSDIVSYYRSNPNIAREQYDNLIAHAKVRGLDKSGLGYYVEKHHIVARCMQGTDGLVSVEM